ncbi:hypothetical protein D3C80_1996820 [compost metagenome]
MVSGGVSAVFNGSIIVISVGFSDSSGFADSSVLVPLSLPGAGVVLLFPPLFPPEQAASNILNAKTTLTRIESVFFFIQP